MKFSIPGPDAPGFLRRQRKALEFTIDFATGKASPETLDKLVQFLSQFVTEPKGREKAKEALWEASETEFMELLSAITGTQEQVPPNNSENSVDG